MRSVAPPSGAADLDPDNDGNADLGPRNAGNADLEPGKDGNADREPGNQDVVGLELETGKKTEHAPSAVEPVPSSDAGKKPEVKFLNVSDGAGKWADVDSDHDSDPSTMAADAAGSAERSDAGGNAERSDVDDMKQKA